MKVRFRGPEGFVCSSQEAAFVSPSQLILSESTEYEVHAISVFEGVTFFLIVDDHETPVFQPRTLFSVTDTSVPADWICNGFATGTLQLVVGPAFLAKDADSYNAMVDQRQLQVQSFWQRIGLNEVRHG